jgi:hypothetical protein
VEETRENRQGSEKLQEKTLEGALEPLELTDRDRGIFKLIHEQRYLAYSHINEAFWEGSSEIAGACYHRLERLMAADYIAKQKVSRKNLTIYLLQEKGLKALEEKGLDQGMPLFKLNDHYMLSMDHDLKVTNIRILFRKLGQNSWTSERVLKERDRRLKVPDGILNIYGEQAAIEFENSTKGRIRYLEVFETYRRYTEFRFVFMIVNEELKDWLIGLEYDAKRVWFVNYKDLFRKREEAIVENRKRRFMLGRIL